MIPQQSSRPTLRAVVRVAPCIAALTIFGWVSLLRAQTASTTAPATAPSTEPVTQSSPDDAVPQHRSAPESFLRSQRLRRDMSRNTYNGFKQGATYRLEELLQFRMAKGNLQIQAGMIADGGQTRVKVEGSEAVWLAMRQPRNIGFPGVPLVVAASTSNVTRIDPDVKSDDEIWSTYVSVSGDNFWIMGQSVSGRVNINQANGQIGVSVMQWCSGPGGNIQSDTVLNAHASSIGQLRADHPDEFRKYVLPLLSKVSDMQWLLPGVADVYVAFPQIPADEQVTRKVRLLLPDLDSDAFPIRDAASTQLAALGPAGVLAVLRMDWSDLSDEQRSRFQALLNDHRRREIPDPAAARKDLNFLADCLEYDDASVRVAAKAAIEQALGQPVSFDVQSTGDARVVSVDAVRKQISQVPVPDTQPSTQPVAGPLERPTD